MVTRKDFTTLADMFAYIISETNKNEYKGLNKDTIDSYMAKLNPNYNAKKFWSAITEQLIEYEQ